jgi:hypothetical protein
MVEQENTTTTESQGPPPLPDPEERKQRMSQAAPVKHADEKFCSNCGAIIKIKALACPKCGKKQGKAGMGCLPTAAIVLAIGVFSIFILGILAAIAIPQFAAYRTRAYQASVKTELREICRAEEDYFAQNNRYTDSLDDLGYIAKPNITIEIDELEDDCFHAKGEMARLKKRYFIDCSCEITEEDITIK